MAAPTLGRPLARLLSPVHEALHAALLTREILGGDETRWPLPGSKSVSFRQACVSGAQALGYRPEPGQRDRKDGNFRWWPTSTEAASAPLRAHELQVLLCGGDPSATQAALQWRKVGSSREWRK